MAFVREFEEREDRGFIGNFLSEFGADIAGTGRILGAAAFSPLDALGADVPIEFEDITSRDVQGLGMIGSLFVGGIGAGAIRGIRAGVGLQATLGRGASKAAAREAREFFLKSAAQTTAFGRAKDIATVAGAEAAAGAFFGSLRELESSESRLEAVLTDAAFFGTIGGSFGALGHAWKATFGKRLAEIKGTSRTQITQRMAERSSAMAQLREIAGVSVRNPETGATASIRRRIEDGAVLVERQTPDGEVVVEEAKDFGFALVDHLSTGFTERLGVARSEIPTEIPGISERVLSEFMRDDSKKVAIDALGDLSVANYKAVREVVPKLGQEDVLDSWLLAETAMHQVDEFGVPKVTPAMRRGVLSNVPKDVARRLGSIKDDAEFLKQAFLEGVVDVENIQHGVEMRSFLDELFINDQVPEAGGWIYSARTPYDATVLEYAMTGQTIGKLHPEVAPVIQMGRAAAYAEQRGWRMADEFIEQIKNTIPTPQLNRIVGILDSVAAEPNVPASRAAALEAARATGDPLVVEGMERMTETLGRTRLRLIAAGRLGSSDAKPEAVVQARQVIAEALEQAPEASVDDLERAVREVSPVTAELIDDAGLAGYFPISYTGGWRLERGGNVAPEFFDSFGDALRAASKLDSEDAFIAPAVSEDLSRRVSSKEMKARIQAVREAEGISAKEAREILEAKGVTEASFLGPRKYSRHLQKRRLGLRDFANDPLDGLSDYLRNIERTLAYNTFERDAAAVLSNIPDAKNQLRGVMQSYVDTLLGKPTWLETAMVKTLQAVAPEISRSSLHKWSSMARRVQSWSKLGGFWSGAVNITQVAVNTIPVIGEKWTAKGLQGWFREKESVLKFLADNEVDLGFHAGVTRDGRILTSESVTQEFKATIARLKIGEGKRARDSAIRTFENASMFAFNGAERFNRVVTFWGAYQKALASNHAKNDAIAYALDIVNKTQFDYTSANIPIALRGPVMGVLGQFKTFFVNEVELIASLDNKTRAKMAGYFMALGGAGSILNVPGPDIVDHASRLFFDHKISEGLTLGAAAAEERGEGAYGFVKAGAFGVPGLLDIDMTNYIGPGGFADLTRGIEGPFLGDVGATLQLFGQMYKDVKRTGSLQAPTINAWAQQVMPAQMRRFTRGAEILSTGEVRNPYSKKLIYRPEERLRWEGALQMIGPQTTRAAAERVMDDVVDRQVRSYRETRASYRQQIAIAMIRRDTAEAQRLRSQARTNGVTFTPAAIRSAIKSFQAPAAERRERRTPLDLRDDLEDFYDEITQG